MKVQKSFKLALNILLHSKLRSWLTIIGIVIGVAAIVAIVSIGEGAQLNVQERLSGLGADLITVSPGFERATGGRNGSQTKSFFSSWYFYMIVAIIIGAGIFYRKKLGRVFSNK